MARPEVLKTGTRAKTRTVAVWLVLSVGLLAPLGFVVYAFVRFEDFAGDVDHRPTAIEFVPVVSDEIGERLLTLTVDWERQAVILAPDFDGLTTALWVSVGDEVQPLDNIISVDGVVRFAWASNEPFFRALSINMHGDDVLELQRLLTARALLDSEVTGWIDWSTQLAIGRLSLELGYESERFEFDPSWVVRIPEAGLTVGELHAVVGGVAPMSGEELILGPPVIVGANVENADGAKLAFAQPMEVTFGQHAVRLSADGGVAEGDFRLLATQLGSPDVSIGADASTSLPVTVRRENPIEAMRVPVSAVVIGDEGHCVWERVGATDAGQPAFEPIRVTLLSEPAQPGLALVEALAEGPVILANPFQVLGATGCL